MIVGHYSYSDPKALLYNPTRFNSNIAFLNLCKDDAQIFGLTKGAFFNIEKNIEDYYGWIHTNRKDFSNPSKHSLFNMSEKKGLNRWFDALTDPLEAKEVFLKYFKPLRHSSDADFKQYLCHKFMLKELRYVTEKMLAIFTDYMGFLKPIDSDFEQCNHTTQKNTTHCFQFITYQASGEQWLISKADLLKLISLREKITDPKEECPRLEFPLCTKNQQQGLRAWLRIFIHEEEMRKMFSSCAFFNNCEKWSLTDMRSIVSSIMSIFVDDLLKMLEKKPDLDFNQIKMHLIFPFKGIPGKDQNTCLNLCHSTQSMLDPCQSDAEALRRKLDQITQKTKTCLKNIEPPNFPFVPRIG